MNTDNCYEGLADGRYERRRKWSTEVCYEHKYTTLITHVWPSSHVMALCEVGKVKAEVRVGYRDASYLPIYRPHAKNSTWLIKHSFFLFFSAVSVQVRSQAVWIIFLLFTSDITHHHQFLILSYGRPTPLWSLMSVGQFVINSGQLHFCTCLWYLWCDKSCVPMSKEPSADSSAECWLLPGQL